MKRTLKGIIASVIASAFAVGVAVLPVMAAGGRNTGITEAEAKAIALKDAGVSEKDVTYIWSKLSMDDGVMEYEVDFAVGNEEYDYDIDANSGRIRSVDRDIETFYSTQAVTSAGTAGVTATAPAAGSRNAKQGITKNEALSIALQDAGFAEKDVSRSRVKQDWDDGRQIYEVKFYSGWVEYNYDIDAATGAILDFDIDD